jgi:hypothetical protein
MNGPGVRQSQRQMSEVGGQFDALIQEPQPISQHTTQIPVRDASLLGPLIDCHRGTSG